MNDRIYPKQSHPQSSACDHCYWAYVSKGDDAEKECFCDLDGEFCYGKSSCEKESE